MNFCEKLNAILTLLNCSNAKMAKVSGIDASLVSRYRTGARVPKAGTAQFLKLCGGIVSYASENCLWERLKEACELAGTGKSEDEIHAYLMPQSKQMNSSDMPHKPKQNTCPFFGEKLNTLMHMLDISNIRLAKSLNVDSSLISRFRNGLRTPPKNSQLIANLCTYFYNRVLAGGFENELSELLNVSKPMVENGGDKLIAYFVDWMLDKTEAQNTNAMDRFLEKLDSFTINKGLQLPPVYSIATVELLSEERAEYIGIDGLRRAVIRFLGCVALSNQPCILKLYSDQNMDWLTADTGFMQKWTALMYAVLLNKNHIKIIHNIDRSLPEMLVAIEKWLPLYMTGMIQSFTCKKAGDGRFVHTFYVAPALAAIDASLVVGTENRGKYHYSSTAESISYYEEQFDSLLEMSKPLVQVFNEHNRGEYHFRMNELAKQAGETKRLLFAPSIATMPKPLLEKILIRNQISQSETKTILSLHDYHVKYLKKELQSGSVVEYVALPNDEALLSGRVELNLFDIFFSRFITYTAEEFSQHIHAIIALLNKNDSYNLIPLPHSPFSHIQMAVKSGVGAIVLKNDDPSAMFWFGHPVMCRAFDEYISAISEKNKISVGNRNNLLEILQKYLV